MVCFKLTHLNSEKEAYELPFQELASSHIISYPVDADKIFIKKCRTGKCQNEIVTINEYIELINSYIISMVQQSSKMENV